ncbi:barnase inhibitor [bacterium]|nr:barnase inhibitor [bacterium]
MKKIEIDGNRFSTLDGFYNEVEVKLTKNLDRKIGWNLDAFNDVLRGGFGVHDYEEEIELWWLNASKSQIDFGYEASIDRLKSMLETCHPSNRDNITKEIGLAENQKGQTLFQTIIAIIESQDHIDFNQE